MLGALSIHYYYYCLTDVDFSLENEAYPENLHVFYRHILDFPCSKPQRFFISFFILTQEQFRYPTSFLLTHVRDFIYIHLLDTRAVSLSDPRYASDISSCFRGNKRELYCMHTPASSISVYMHCTAGSVLGVHMILNLFTFTYRYCT